MKAEAAIEVNCGDKTTAINVRQSVSHEGKIGKRSKAVVEVRGQKVLIRIKAEDVVALRATLNSFLRGVQLIEGARAKVFQRK